MSIGILKMKYYDSIKEEDLQKIRSRIRSLGKVLFKIGRRTKLKEKWECTMEEIYKNIHNYLEEEDDGNRLKITFIVRIDIIDEVCSSLEKLKCILIPIGEKII